jgi:N utilization substance protein A
MQEKARAQMASDAEALDKLEKDRMARRLEEERKHPDDLSQEERLARVRGVGTTNVDSFKQSGYGTVEEIVKEIDLTRLGNVAGIGIKKARQIKAAAEHYLQEETRRRAELDALKKAAPPLLG